MAKLPDDEAAPTQADDRSVDPSIDADEVGMAATMGDVAATSLELDDSSDPPSLSGEHPAALLVDCGTDADALAVILREIEDNDCRPIVRRAYGDWRTATANQKAWSDHCVTWGLEPVQVHGHNYHTTSGRNAATLVRMSIDAVELAADDDLAYFFVLAGSPHLAPLALYLQQQEKHLIVVGVADERRSNAFFDLAWHREILPLNTDREAAAQRREGEAESVTTVGAQPAGDEPATSTGATIADNDGIQADDVALASSQRAASPLADRDWWVPFVREQCIQEGERGRWLPLTKLGDLLRYNFPGYDPQIHGRLLQLIKQRLDIFAVHPDPAQTYDFPVTHFVKLRDQRLPSLPEPQPRDRRPPPTPRFDPQARQPGYQPSGYKTPRYARRPGYDEGWDEATGRPWIR